jgi:hypothetical protein
VIKITVIKMVLNQHSKLILCLILVFQLGYLGKKMRFSPAILVRAFSTNVAVQESLPEEVVEASFMIKSASIKEFSLSKGLNADPLFKERMIEYLYPVRFSESSSVLVARTEEMKFEPCKVLEVKKSIGIYDCTNK